MSDSSSIEWTDTTWSPITGCTRKSEGCDHCYSARMTYRLEMMGQQKYTGLTVVNPKGDRHFNGVVKCHEGELSAPFKFRKPRRIFVNSMSDTFHPSVPFEFVDKMLAVMAMTPQHTYQILTKRPERMAEYLNDYRSATGMKTDENVWKTAACMDGDRFAAAYKPRIDDTGVWPLENVWLGTSVENQAAADERIPHLLKCPAAVRFLSVEPLLGAVDLGDFLDSETYGDEGGDGPCASIDWVIVGGESGPGARPFNVEWARSIIAQCKSANVACFVKQLGANPVKGGGRCRDCADHDGICPYSQLPCEGLKDKKGGDPDEWPADLRVREFPEMIHATN